MTIINALENKNRRLGHGNGYFLVNVYSFTYRQTGDAALAYALVGITVRR